MRRAKLQPIDYAVIVGGPIAFLLILWFGIHAILGPAPRPNPVQLLRDGAIEIGAPMNEVTQKLGRPSRVQTTEDGTIRYIYTRTVFEQATRSDSLDEAVIEFTPSGRVQAISFDRSAPPAKRD